MVEDVAELKCLYRLHFFECSITAGEARHAAMLAAHSPYPVDYATAQPCPHMPSHLAISLTYLQRAHFLDPKWQWTRVSLKWLFTLPPVLIEYVPEPLEGSCLTRGCLLAIHVELRFLTERAASFLLAAWFCWQPPSLFDVMAPFLLMSLTFLIRDLTMQICFAGGSSKMAFARSK